MPESVGTRNTIQNGCCKEKIGKWKAKGLPEAGYDPVQIWNRKVPNTELDRFQKYIENKYKKRFASYWEFHRWTIENYVNFWEEMWNVIKIRTSKPYNKVFIKTGPGFLDNEWFSGALFNFAENVLRIRDNRIALLYLDEMGNKDTVTYAEMFEEVKLYTAAFRKNGLKKGDTVACFMSNRKEAIFGMLATTSIGAIWGGPLPSTGGKGASNVVKIMDAKFLLTIDHHLDETNPTKMLDRIPVIVSNCPKLEKIVLIVTQKETYSKDLSNIRNCILLEDFLESGRNADRSVSDISFEQLPFNYPICINFSSGTTGIPKPPVHSAGSLIAHLKDFILHLDVKCGDILANICPVGWTAWDYFLPSLTLGVKLFLLSSSPYSKINGKNFWDIMATYKVKLAFLATSVIDNMEKMKMEPSPESNMDCLKIILVGGLPVKKENVDYLKNKVNKNMFVGNLYGATEFFGTLSGYNFNMPAYAGEIQVPSLGLDIQCFDSKGKSVIGQRGEVVLCTPAPNFPIGLWKDEDNKRITEIYLSKHAGVWCQHDECWINPRTNGLIVIGRSDDTLKQNGERFAASDIYFAIHGLEEIQDYICVSQERGDGVNRAVLFVKMKNNYKLNSEMRVKIENAIVDTFDYDFLPEVILEVPDIPHNLNDKRVESVVRKIVATNQIPEVMNIKNPDSLKHFVNIPEIVNYKHV